MVVEVGATYRITDTASCKHCGHPIHRGRYIADGGETGWTHHFREKCPPLTVAEPSGGSPHAPDAGAEEGGLR
jgi:hypothetical protein